MKQFQMKNSPPSKFKRKLLNATQRINIGGKKMALSKPRAEAVS